MSLDSVAPSRTPLRVLLVEDSEADAQLLLHELARVGYEVSVERVQTADEMRAALQQESWHIVLSDYSLPTFSAPAALKILRDADEDLPFIIVSGTIGEDTAVEALRAGACDFIVKGKLARLGPALDRELRDARARRERHAVEHQLRQAQARSMYALDAAGAGIWEFDLATGATRWNERVSLMFGLGPRPVETVIDEFRARVHADDRGMIDAAIAQSIETDEPFRVDFRVPWPDGSIHWLVAKGRVLRNDASEPTGMMGICIDVTDRKELEQQLQHAQKLDSLGQFAGSITHDFNNVLTVILGFSDMLLGGLDPADERARDIEEIKKAGESGQRLARQLLAFSRQQSLEPTALDLNGSITSIVGILQQLLGANVALESVLADGLGTVWADAGQLQQILMNLAVNARDAMTKDGRLRIETRRATVSEWVAASQNVRPGAYIVLAVTDTGTGMSAETQARIFEPFFTTKAPGKGTGLGLSTVYGIVRQSKGFMEVVSTIGQGTTFRIYLPRLEDSK